MYRIYRIGLAIDTVGSYGRGVIRGIMGYCRTHPHLEVSVEPIAAGHVSGAYAHIEQWDVDGLIVQVLTRASEDEVLVRGLPAINVSNVSGNAPRLPTVLPDDQAIGTLAAEYLLSLSPRCIGYCWPGDSHYGRLRLDGFTRTVARAGCELRECNAHREDVGHWLAKLPRPAAVLGCNDEWAHFVMNVARRMRLRVPDDVAVLGVDDDELFNMLVTPSLSSIATPAEQIGEQAAQMLDEMMQQAGKQKAPAESPSTSAPNAAPAPSRHGPAPLKTFPPLRVVERESTRTLRAEDPDVQLALRFIRDHCAHPLSVTDLLKNIPLTRRTLERRFRATVGRSLQEEICRVRLEKAKQLLASTNLAIPQVARGSGFNSENRFGIAFRKSVGMPPTEYRWRTRGLPPGSRRRPTGQ